MIWNDGRKYNGDWKLGLMHGYGEYKWIKDSISYKGGYKNGLKQGKGTMYWHNKNIKSEDIWN